MYWRDTNSFEFEEYTEFVKKLVENAKKEVDGSTIYGIPVDVNNPEELIASLYYLWKNEGFFRRKTDV